MSMRYVDSLRSSFLHLSSLTARGSWVNIKDLQGENGSHIIYFHVDFTTIIARYSARTQEIRHISHYHIITVVFDMPDLF